MYDFNRYFWHQESNQQLTKLDKIIMLNKLFFFVLYLFKLRDFVLYGH